MPTVCAIAIVSEHAQPNTHKRAATDTHTDSREIIAIFDAQCHALPGAFCNRVCLYHTASCAGVPVVVRIDYVTGRQRTMQACRARTISVDDQSEFSSHEGRREGGAGDAKGRCPPTVTNKCKQPGRSEIRKSSFKRACFNQVHCRSPCPPPLLVKSSRLRRWLLCICMTFIHLCTICSFKKARVVAPLYTGGPVAITLDGERLVTCVGEEAILTDVQQGTEICRFAGVRCILL